MCVCVCVCVRVSEREIEKEREREREQGADTTHRDVQWRVASERIGRPGVHAVVQQQLNHLGFVHW